MPIPISQRGKKEVVSVSPRGAIGIRSQNDNFSPRSSNVSSFYMDHIDDMLPEKILVA